MSLITSSLGFLLSGMALPVEELAAMNLDDQDPDQDLPDAELFPLQPLNMPPIIPPALPANVLDVFDVTGRPISVTGPACPESTQTVLTYTPRGGLLWYYPPTGQMYMREGLRNGVPEYMCATLYTVPASRRPDGRCRGRRHPFRAHSSHTDPVSGSDLRSWLYSFLLKGFIAVHGRRLNAHQFALLSAHFQSIIFPHSRSRTLPQISNSTYDGLIARGNPFPDEYKRCLVVPTPLLAHRIGDPAAAMEFTCIEFWTRYGPLIDAMHIDVRTGYEELRGQPLPSREVIYPRRLSIPG